MRLASAAVLLQGRCMNPLLHIPHLYILLGFDLSTPSIVYLAFQCLPAMCLFLATVLYAVICSLPLVRAEGNCTFASRERIIHLFTALAKKDYPTFFGAVVDNVNWTVQGTHPLAGQYYNKTYFVINSIARLSNIQNNSAPNGMDTFNIVGGCNEEWSSQEISSHQVMKNGSNPLTSHLSFMTLSFCLSLFLHPAYQNSHLVSLQASASKPTSTG